MSHLKRTLCVALVFLIIALSGCTDILLPVTTSPFITSETSATGNVDDSNATTTEVAEPIFSSEANQTQSETAVSQTKAETTIPQTKPETTAIQTPATGTMIVHFIDVGQGDAIFIELPGGKTIAAECLRTGSAPSQRSIAQKYNRDEASISRTVKEFLKKLKSLLNEG